MGTEVMGGRPALLQVVWGISGSQGRASLFSSGKILTTPVVRDKSGLHPLTMPEILCLEIDSFGPWRHFLFKCSLFKF